MTKAKQNTIGSTSQNWEPRHVLSYRSDNVFLTLHRSTMGDPAESNKRLTPDWQHEEAASDSTEDCKKASETADVTEPPPPRASLIEQASNFLKDEEIRDASRERKISFLRSKGLTDEEVYRLLEIPFDGIKAEVQDQEAAPEQAVCFRPIYS